MLKKRIRRTAERRTQPRADARLSMRVEGQTDLGVPQIVTESQNISTSGVYCSSSHYLAPLSKVALTIVLPRLPNSTGSQELIKCEGIVVRCQPTGKKGQHSYELACMFSDLSDQYRAIIDDFVTWRNLQALRAAAKAVSTPKLKRAGTSTAVAKRTASQSTGARTGRTPAKRAARPAAGSTGRKTLAAKSKSRTAARRSVR